jgi:uncharacterized membrane protein (DUF485 family)
MSRIHRVAAKESLTPENRRELQKQRQAYIIIVSGFLLVGNTFFFLFLALPVYSQMRVLYCCGGEASGRVTAIYEEHHRNSTYPMVTYTYRLNNGRTYGGRSQVLQNEYAILKVGQAIPIRYSLKREWLSSEDIGLNYEHGPDRSVEFLNVMTLVALILSAIYVFAFSIQFFRLRPDL